MLFLWSREAPPGPRAGPWFAWFATAVVLWRRRNIANAILAASPLRRLLKKRPSVAKALKAKASSMGEGKVKLQQHRGDHTHPREQQQQQQAALPKEQRIHPRDRAQNTQPKQKSIGIRARVKRLYNESLAQRVPSTASLVHLGHQGTHYRVTRSGRVYGKCHPITGIKSQL